MTDDRSIHERARLLAADALDEELSHGDAEWLASHLAECGECRDAAADFATIRAELRALPAPVPPRDLWARTAAALDEVERSRTRRRPLPRLSLSMLGTSAAVSAVVAMVSISIVSQPISPAAPGGGIVAAVPTPTLARATDVLASNSAVPASGAPIVAITNSNNLVLIDPRTGALLENKVACATSDCTVDRGNSQHIGTVDATNINGATVDTINQKAVVWTDKAISVVPVKTLAPSTTPPPATSPTPTVTATAPTTASAKATKTPSPSKTPLPSASRTPTPSTSPSTFTATSTPASSTEPPPTPSASVTQPQSILNGYAPVGDPAFSPDGVWLAFAARQVGSTSGSDVFVWRVGEGVARPVTTSHRATFSGWFGSSNRMLISETLTADQYAALPQPTPDADATANPSPTASPSPTANPSPTATLNASAPPSAQASGSAPPTQIPQGATLLVAASYIVDPATCDAARFVRPILDPVVDPTGQRVVYRTATVYLDPAGNQKFTAADVNYDLLSDMGTVTTPLCPVTPQNASPAPTSTSPIPTPTPTPVTTAISTPSATITATPARTSSATPRATKTPASEGTLAPGASPTLPPPATLPQRLPVADAGAVTGDWLARWDPSGMHVAVWVGSAGAPEGQLRLFAVDPTDNRLSTSQQLFGALALRAFQLDESDVIYTASAQVSDGKVHKQAWPDLPPKRDPAPTQIPTQAPADASDRPGH